MEKVILFECTLEIKTLKIRISTWRAISWLTWLECKFYKWKGIYSFQSTRYSTAYNTYSGMYSYKLLLIALLFRTIQLLFANWNCESFQTWLFLYTQRSNLLHSVYRQNSKVYIKYTYVCQCYNRNNSFLPPSPSLYTV